MATKTFMSFAHNQRIVVQPGRLETRDVNNRVVSSAVSSKSAEFEDHRFETDDPEIIQALKENEMFQTPRGIWLEGEAPDEPKPSRNEQHKAIAAAAAKQDVEKLNEVLEEERETHNRLDVISAGETAIANIEVPKVETAAALTRQEEPGVATSDLPRVDPAEGTAPVDSEAIIKSEEVAQGRADAVEAGNVEEKMEAEAEAVADGETDPKKIAKAGVKSETKSKPKSEGKASSSKSPAKSKSSGANARSTKS